MLDVLHLYILLPVVFFNFFMDIEFVMFIEVFDFLAFEDSIQNFRFLLLFVVPRVLLASAKFLAMFQLLRADTVFHVSKYILNLRQ